MPNEFNMTDRQQFACLHMAEYMASAFEASPRESLKPAEVARLIRQLVVECCDDLVVEAFTIASYPGAVESFTEELAMLEREPS